MVVSEVVVFMIMAKYTSRTSVLGLSINRIQDSCVLTYNATSLIAYNTTGMMHLKA